MKFNIFRNDSDYRHIGVEFNYLPMHEPAVWYISIGLYFYSVQVVKNRRVK